jgi:hypothetical protein
MTRFALSHLIVVLSKFSTMLRCSGGAFGTVRHTTRVSSGTLGQNAVTSRRMNTLLAVLAIAPFLALVGCCPHELTSPQAVNVDPLFSAVVPQDRSTLLPLFPNASEVIAAGGRHKDGYPAADGILDWVQQRYPEDRYGYLVVTADVYLVRSPAEAERFFDFEWRKRWWKPDLSKFTLRGTGENRCVISYYRRPRYGSDVPFSCSHSTDHDSFVTFLKGRVIVTIEQRSDGTDPAAKERLIREVAQLLTSSTSSVASDPTTRRSH